MEFIPSQKGKLMLSFEGPKKDKTREERIYKKYTAEDRRLLL